MKNDIKLAAVVVALAVVVAVAAVVAAPATARKWAVVNHGGVDVWVVDPDGVAHAIPLGCRGVAATWRQGDKEVVAPEGAKNWPVINLPGNAGQDLLRKEKVTLDKRDYYSRHFTTR